MNRADKEYAIEAHQCEPFALPLFSLLSPVQLASSFGGRSFGRLGLSFGCCGFGFGLGRFGVAVGRSGRGGIFFGGFLVFFAAVIGDIKAAAFEEQTGAAADGASDFSLAPAFPGAGDFGAGCERFCRDGLNLFKLVSALFADVFICRHTQHCSNKVNLLGQEWNS